MIRHSARVNERAEITAQREWMGIEPADGTHSDVMGLRQVANTGGAESGATIANSLDELVDAVRKCNGLLDETRIQILELIQEQVDQPPSI